MQLPKQAVLYIVSCAISAVGLAMLVVGVITPDWTYNDVNDGNDTIRFTLGLWQYCEDDVCQDITDSRPATLMACKVLALVSAGSAMISFGSLFFHLLKQICKSPSPQCFFTLAMVSGGCSAICIIISVCIWRAEYFDDAENTYVGYSLILPIVGGILVAFSSSVGAFSSRNITIPQIK